MEETFPGEVKVEVVEVRFAFSGKVAGVEKRTGDRVEKGEVLARLDNQQLQAELDRQLAQYEKTRAEFEIYSKLHLNPGDDLGKYAKTIEQSQLDASVKEVELAKMRLDLVNLVSPVAGIIVDDGGNRKGANVTPAANIFRIADIESVRFEFEVTADKLGQFGTERQAVVKVAEQEVAGITMWPVGDDKKFRVGVKLDTKVGWVPGQPGEARVKFV